MVTETYYVNEELTNEEIENQKKEDEKRKYNNSDSKSIEPKEKLDKNLNSEGMRNFKKYLDLI